MYMSYTVYSVRHYALITLHIHTYTRTCTCGVVSHNAIFIKKFEKVWNNKNMVHVACNVGKKGLESLCSIKHAYLSKYFM